MWDPLTGQFHPSSESADILLQVQGGVNNFLLGQHTPSNAQETGLCQVRNYFDESEAASYNSGAPLPIFFSPSDILLLTLQNDIFHSQPDIFPTHDTWSSDTSISWLVPSTHSGPSIILGPDELQTIPAIYGENSPAEPITTQPQKIIHFSEPRSPWRSM